MREQDIKRQEEVKKEVQALRIKKNSTPEKDILKKPNQSYSFAAIEQRPSEEETTFKDNQSLPVDIYSVPASIS